MKQNNIKETTDLIIENDTILLSEIPDNLLDVWIIGIANKSDYIYERDFIINIFNEIYEGHKELQNINTAEDDSDREEYRQRFEELLKAEKHRRLTGQRVVEDCSPFDLI